MIHRDDTETRRVNSQFDNQLENFDTESDFIAVPEKGAIIYIDGRAYYGNGLTWIELATSRDIPEINSGFEMVNDGAHTNVDNAQNITAVEQIIANNANVVQGTLGAYDGTSNKFYLQSDAIYTITISFTAQVSANNQHGQLFFGYNGIPSNGYSDILYFAKGNNVAHQFSRTYQIIGNTTTETDGINLYLFPSHEGKLWGAQFTIQRAF